MTTLMLLITGLFMMQDSEGTSPANKADYYYQIPDYPEGGYTANNVTARMVDGLGFRYYWATEGLRGEDLAYEPGNEGQSMGSTLNHIYGLSSNLVNGIKAEVNQRLDMADMTPDEIRAATLENFKLASERLKANPEGSMDDYQIIFPGRDSNFEMPFWNMLNGMLADAIYHTGQVVSFRRSAGNPIDGKISVLQGRRRE